MANKKSEIKSLNFKQASELKTSEFNRTLSLEHVARLMTDMMNNFESFGPIIISQRGTIIDGAHRREAFLNCMKQGKIPADSKLLVKVNEVSPEEEQDLIRRTNSHTKNWVMSDYVKSNIAAGNDSIKKMAEWCSTRELCINSHRKTDPIKYTFGVAFLLGKLNGNLIKDSSFSLTEDDIQIGTEIYDEINELRKILKWDVPVNRYDYWAVAWRTARQWHPFDVWKKEFKRMANQLHREIPYTKKGFSTMLGYIDSAINRNEPGKKKPGRPKKIREA